MKVAVEDHERSGAFEHEAADTALMARSLAGLYLAGATMVVLTLLLPHDADPDELGTILVLGNAYVIGALLLTFAGRIPAWGLAALLTAGTVHITAVAWFSDEPISPLIFFYLWVMIYSAYFFSRAVAIAEIVFVGLNYGLFLVLTDPPSGESWWVVGMGSMLVATWLVA